MAAIGTLPVVLGTGDHASRPAASAVGAGGLYSCTTHSLVYQTDGSSWSTWATLGDATGANPNFTTIELGHASDTTLTRVSAGVVAVEGTNIVKAGAITTSGLTQATGKLLGRNTASTGAVEEITLGTNLSFSGTTLNATGSGGASLGTQGTTSIGATGYRTPTTSTQYLKKLTLASTKAILGIAVAVKGDGAASFGLAPVIYTDSAGVPTLGIATANWAQDSGTGALQAGLFLNTTGRFVFLPGFAYLTAADYWFGAMIIQSAGVCAIAYASGGGDHTRTTRYLADQSLVAENAATSDDYSIYIVTLG